VLTPIPQVACRRSSVPTHRDFAEPLGRNGWASVALSVGGAGQVDASGGVGGGAESGAVEGGVAVVGAVATPQVGLAQAGEGVGDGDLRGDLPGRAGYDGWRWCRGGVVGGDVGGDVEYVVDVGGGVVVGEQGTPDVEVVAGAVVAEVRGGGVVASLGL
jgi:hypothetical protein